GEGVQENELDALGGAIALFGDDDLSLGALLRGLLGLVEVWPVDEDDHVSVLLDGARFAQVGELRPAVFAFRGASQLAQHQYRRFELLAKPFRPRVMLPTSSLRLPKRPRAATSCR